MFFFQTIHNIGGNGVSKLSVEVSGLIGLAPEHVRRSQENDDDRNETKLFECVNNTVILIWFTSIEKQTHLLHADTNMGEHVKEYSIDDFTTNNPVQLLSINNLNH